MDSVLAPYVAQGKATYPDAKSRFLAGLPPHSRFLVSIMFYDQAGHREFGFIEVKRIGQDTAYGSLASNLEVVKGFDPEAKYQVVDAAVMDWTIARPDGTEEGNAVGKFLDSLTSPPCQ